VGRRGYDEHRKNRFERSLARALFGGGLRAPAGDEFMDDIRGLFLLALTAALAPLLARLPFLRWTPIVVLELLFGVAIGPGGANLASTQGGVGFLGQLGLVYLFFQAGLEFAPDRIGAAPLRLGALAWLVSFALAVAFVSLLYVAGLVHAPLLVAIALPTTALGVLIPILRQNGALDTNFGRYVLGAAAAGELGPMILTPIVLAEAHAHLQQTLLLLLFMSIAIGATMLAKMAHSQKLSAQIARWMEEPSAPPLRIAILLLLGLVALANELGMEVVLGAYTAGVVVAILTRGSPSNALEERLTAMGSGFLVPMFFITSGMEFDFAGLISSPESLFRLVLFFFGIVFIRVAPLFLYRRAVEAKDLTPLGLFSGTTLSLVVALTFLGVRSGQMLPENATALVGAAVLSVITFPTLAIWLRAQPEHERPDRVLTAVLCVLGDRFSIEYARLTSRVAQGMKGKS
jgi:Kef-type K+ transport system membrane component KefB